jgi:hypothetical protein
MILRLRLQTACFMMLPTRRNEEHEVFVVPTMNEIWFRKYQGKSRTNDQLVIAIPDCQCKQDHSAFGMAEELTAHPTVDLFRHIGLKGLQAGNTSWKKGDRNLSKNNRDGVYKCCRQTGGVAVLIALCMAR